MGEGDVIQPNAIFGQWLSSSWHHRSGFTVLENPDRSVLSSSVKKGNLEYLADVWTKAKVAGDLNVLKSDVMIFHFDLFCIRIATLKQLILTSCIHLT
jgi:hypothetical protein